MSSAEVMIPTDITLARDPKLILAEAGRAATELIAAVQQNGWSKNLGGQKPHLMFEAWNLLGTFYHISSRVVPGSVKFIEVAGAMGYEAEAEAIDNRTGFVVSSASAMCLNDESNWAARPVYEADDEGERRKTGGRQVPWFQLRSMAQTRALVKALKPKLSWIVAMANFDPTAADELPPAGRSIKQPQPKQTEGNKITDPMRKRLWAVGKEAGKTNEDIAAVVRRYGFDSTNDITRDQYDAIVAELQKSDAAE
jgi:hypothetical protein